MRQWFGEKKQASCGALEKYEGTSPGGVTGAASSIPTAAIEAFLGI